MPFDINRRESVDGTWHSSKTFARKSPEFPSRERIVILKKSPPPPPQPLRKTLGRMFDFCAMKRKNDVVATVLDKRTIWEAVFINRRQTDSASAHGRERIIFHMFANTFRRRLFKFASRSLRDECKWDVLTHTHTRVTGFRTAINISI